MFEYSCRVYHPPGEEQATAPVRVRAWTRFGAAKKAAIAVDSSPGTLVFEVHKWFVTVSPVDSKSPPSVFMVETICTIRAYVSQD